MPRALTVLVLCVARAAAAGLTVSRTGDLEFAVAVEPASAGSWRVEITAPSPTMTRDGGGVLVTEHTYIREFHVAPLRIALRSPSLTQAQEMQAHTI